MIPSTRDLIAFIVLPGAVWFAAGIIFWQLCGTAIKDALTRPNGHKDSSGRPIDG